MLKYTTFIYYLLLGSSDTFPVRVKGFAFLSHSTTRQSLPLVPSYNKLFYTTTTITNHASYRKRFTNPLRCATLGETAPKTTTYISNYVVDIHSITKQNEIWKLYREGDIEKRKEEQPYICLSGERMNSSNTIRIKVTQHVTPNGSKINGMEEDAYFLPVLGRILAQRLLAIETPSSSGSSTRLLSCCATEVCIDLPTLGESSTMDSTPTRTITTILPAENHPIDNPAVVFEDLLPNGTTKGYELVELVDIQGQALAAIPRNFIHNYNMLHRGIGVLVVQPEFQLPITPTIQDFTNTKVYCHQRTWSKRIFPGLYDMFIGGVSAVDEPSHDTAKRELEEELGIPVDLSSLSPPLFQCTIRTSYNHCRVTVFFYQCTADTHITVRQSA
jgi:8-oxo-dGTP pyrophosphatase MutT (NUDIX family)